ncbi:hypothetical protein [Synechococcus sp. CBW1107]|uniref:hypothetical protein n=1 Tax=Synechococcus sp. CBW1107 TaxID=2789857 RepID=UPI002AD3FC1D|nr:hypothetical protein [Synechococcus sp. CBW1107]CAK6687706.1 hypothetical protein IFHNHDMJ_00256 [Synechococcus sp. CBW1107]
MSPRRGIPTSRAYWELKADQLLNRVFDPAPTIEVELCDTPVAGSLFSAARVSAAATPMPAEQPVAPAMQAVEAGLQTATSPGSVPAPMAVAEPMAAATAPAAAVAPMAGAPPEPPDAPLPHHQLVADPLAASGRRGMVPNAVQITRIPWHRRLGEWVSERPGLALAGFGGTCLAMGASSLLLLSHWNATQQALRQERNLLLVERLRALGPAATTTPAGNTDPAEGKRGAPPEEGVSASLPPPPPDEPWMEELATLPQGGAPTAAPLRVPVSSSIATPAPASSGGGGGSAQASSASADGSEGGGGGGDAPQLVGVVQIPGRGGSAIFQMGGTSTTAGVGESIGGSGWRLRSATGDSAVIERGGQQRRISISSGF